jgi:hypothetical protein
MRRLLVAAATALALSVPASVAVIGTSAPAWAASSVSCGKLSGTITGNITITKCTPKSATNKSASAPASALTSGGTLTWASSGGTTTVSMTVTSPGQGGCKAGYTEYDANGHVTGGTSTYTHVGDVTSTRACVSTAKNKIALVKGTKALL